jgi:hypothetical protein
MRGGSRRLGRLHRALPSALRGGMDEKGDPKEEAE